MFLFFKSFFLFLNFLFLFNNLLFFFLFFYLLLFCLLIPIIPTFFQFLFFFLILTSLIFFLLTSSFSFITFCHSLPNITDGVLTFITFVLPFFIKLSLDQIKYLSIDLGTLLWSIKSNNRSLDYFKLKNKSNYYPELNSGSGTNRTIVHYTISNWRIKITILRNLTVVPVRIERKFARSAKSNYKRLKLDQISSWKTRKIFLYKNN